MTQAIRDDFLFIPLSGERELSARLFRPRMDGRYPAILDFSPYRCFDLFRGPAESTLAVWAEHGYATLAVDIAGSGASSGVLLDEYLNTEIDDALAVLSWCSEQSWCDGKLGLSGLSWAAFTALRVAGRKPKALKAMVLGGVSEDGWQTDIHYKGGISYMAQTDWAGVMLMFNALPPDPTQAKAHWQSQWLERLNGCKPFILPWLEHGCDDAYWQQKKAPCDGDVPLFLYSGFADKYATSVLRIQQQWKGPIATLIGPWDHSLPHLSSRTPCVDFVQLALGWWDCHLKGGSAPNLAPLTLWTGSRWASVAEFQTIALCLDGMTLGVRCDEVWHRPCHRAPRIAHLHADLYEDVPFPIDLDGVRVAWSAPAETATEYGPIAALEATVKGEGPVIARLIDMAPDGSSLRISTATLLVTTPGPITMSFQACAFVLGVGHNLGLALTTDGWPTFWPSSSRVELKEVRLHLTQVIGDTKTFSVPATRDTLPFEPTKWLGPQVLAFDPEPQALCHDTAYGYHLAATATDYALASRFEIKRLADDQAFAAKSYRIVMHRPGFSVCIDSRLEVRSTPTHFNVTWAVTAQQDGQIVHKTEQKSQVRRISP